MRIVPPQMWNCHFASLWKNNKRPCLFSKKANCKLEVIVIQLSFSFLWRKTIFMLHSIPAFRNAFFCLCVRVFGISTGSYYKWIISVLLKKKFLSRVYWKPDCFTQRGSTINFLGFHWRLSIVRLHRVRHRQFSRKPRRKTTIFRRWAEKNIFF